MDPSAPQPHRPDLPALTGLRFFAALWVVYFHLAPQLMAGAPGPLRALVGRGWMGVPFFFMLSGFILAHVYGERFSSDSGSRRDRGSFWWARLARIYPMYLLALAAYYPLFLRIFAGRLWTARIVAEQVATVLLVQAWFPFLPVQWNHPGWSLSVEAFFYATFPWMAAGIGRLSRRIHGWWLAAGFLALQACLQTVFASVPAAAVGGTGDDVRALTIENLRTLFPPFWIPLFLAGIALHTGWMTAAGKGFRLPRGTAIVALAAAACFASIPLGLGWVSAVGTIGAETLFAVMIVAFAQPAAASSLLARPLFVLLGEASYGLYLLHIPVNGLLSVALHRPFGRPVATSWFEFDLLAAGLVALCIVLNLAFEHPMRRWILAHRPGRARTGRSKA